MKRDTLMKQVIIESDFIRLAASPNQIKAIAIAIENDLSYRHINGVSTLIKFVDTDGGEDEEMIEHTFYF